jgi:FtsP/CotA-like multicopper oxidase with cupredoxin domain
MNRKQRFAGAARVQRPLVTRRRLVGGGAATLGIAALGSSLRPWARPAEARGAPANAADDDIAAAEQVEGGSVFVEPIVRRSSDGILDTSLIARPDLNAPPGRMNYDGQLPGPTLRAQPGDTLRIFLANGLGGQITNLHTHGLHVSPSGNSDNVFVHIEPGDSFQYEISIPDDHPSGLFWYHPHHHGNSMQQVAGGLAGAIVIDGLDELIPGIDTLRQRLMVLQGPFLDDDGPHYLVNGVENPVIAMQPGERQFWQVLNANANGHYLLTLSGHSFVLIEEDGSPVVAPRILDTLLLGPGERAGLLIDAGDRPGAYQLRSLAWGEGGQQQDEFLVATAFVVDGEPVETGPLPETVFRWPDLADAAVDRQRIIVFEMNSSDPYFAIDGKAFDQDVVDQVVQLDAIEEWVIRNDSDEWHPFHIHVNDFQVMSVNGEPLPVNRHDTYPLPPNGEIVIRIHFADFTGKFVYHCHILAHEDFGMMAVVEVVGPKENGLSVAASGLASPRDMAWDADGTMYVVQSGTGVTDTSVGTAAAFVKIVDGCPVEVASGLPSSTDPFRDVLGPSGLAFLDDTLYVLQTATGLYAEMDPDRPNGIYAVEPETRSLRLVADLTTWIRDNPVKFTPGDANELGEPFRILAADGGFWVLEANRGEVLRVTVDGEVTRVADLSEGHPVLTGFALAPEGGVYVGDLTPAPHEDGSAKIIHVAEDGSVSDVWTNLTTVVGILVDGDGTLYALEMATDNENGMRAGTGKLVRQTGVDQSEDVITGLDYPIGLRFGPDGAIYIAFPAYGENDVSGAVLRYEFGAPEPVAFNANMVVAATCPGAVPYAPPAPSDVGTPVAPPDHAHDDGGATPSSELTIDIQDFAYNPATANVAVGARVTWTNSDALAHTSTAADGTFDSGNIPAGGTYSFTFDTAGTYPYTCTYHPQMSGTIVVS